jgi:hypothetical protein
MIDALRDIHLAAKREFNLIQQAQRQERLQSLKDRRFYSIAGAQWEGELGKQFENKPKLEVNKLHLSVMRIINDYLMNRVTVDFVDRPGSSASKLSDTLDGLYRADEQDSNAEEAYDNAFEEAVGGGIGAWRLRTVYEDEEDDENECQRIAIEPIYDADSTVFFDLGCKRQDKSDAKACFVLISMTPDDFKAKYPNEQLANVEKVVHQHEFDWVREEVIFVAEYYRVEYVPATVYIYQTIDGAEERYTEQDFELNPMLRETLDAMGSVELRQKKVKKQKVHKYLMTGAGMLEDYGIISGNAIPIIMTYGKRWYVDGIERAMGHVRMCKDIQRLKNMQLSKLAEISAISSIEKPIFTAEQIAGHQQEWADDNISNYPFLTINSMVDKDGTVVATGPAGYTKAPDVPQPLAHLLAGTEQDLKDLLGNPQAGEEVVTNLSGKAVELVQNSIEKQSYVYMSNFAKAIKRSGEVWLGIAKDVFVEDGREMQIIGKQNATSTVKLNTPMIDDNGNRTYDNDISKARCNVAVDVGPSSSSKRSATVRALTTMMGLTQDPETQQVLSSMTMMNMEGEGIDDVRKFFRQKLIRQGVIEPNAKERKQLETEAANAKPDPNEEFLKAEAERARAEASELRARTIKTLAGAENLAAETIEILAGIDQNERRTILENIKVLEEMQQPTATTPAVMG